MIVEIPDPEVILAVVLPVFVGLFYESKIEALFGGQLILVGCMLLITGALLFLADKAKHAEKKVGLKVPKIEVLGKNCP